VPEDTFLIRSSLDSDLVAAFGHNPYILMDPQGISHLDVYPGATFHKAQVGSGLPSTLFVPDSPEGFVPGATLDIPPTNNPTHSTDPSNKDAQGKNLPFKTAPFVSTAIPFGTPVGSYYGSLQAFEGLDGTGYPTVAAKANPPGVPSDGFGGLTAQIYPPQYGTVVGGIGTPKTDAAGRLLDTIQTTQSGTNPAVSLMPNSSNATVLNVKVIEDRLTDGATFGAVPMIDIQGAGPKNAAGVFASTPDFAPAAFRDPASKNISIYWTSGRTTAGATSPFNIWAANVPFNTVGLDYFLPSDPTQYWWKPFIPITSGNSTNSGLSIAQGSLNQGTVGAFVVNVQSPPTTAAYQNTLLYYPVTAASGILGSVQPVTNDPTQVKYGVKGLLTETSFSNTTPNLWAFWTATTRGRTAVYYNSKLSSSNTWIPATGPTTTGLLPIPAGLTAVADPAPLLLFGNVLVNGVPTLKPTIDVTYSGTGADGNVDLYESRYQPDATKSSLLDLLPFPAVTEILTASGVSGGWYQARDVAWSRTSKLNLSINGKPILYDATGTALFSRAVFDKATGLLVLTGVPNLLVNNSPTTYAFNVPSSTTVTAYIDLATGRVRFSAAPSSVVTAFFSPLAKRMTSDSRADTGPTTFLDGAFKPNDTPANTGNVAAITPLRADRRWFIWRKSGAGGAAPSATVYYKTQRLTAYLPRPVDPTKTINISLNGTAYTGPLDVQNIPPTLDNQGNIKSLGNARIYFPISSGAEGATITGSYTPNDGTPGINIADTVQWQDEIRANDSVTPPTNATTGLANIIQGYALPLDTTVNENNVSAFLDPLAGLNTPHKVWVFWNSTRNGTADLYYETINPLFAAQ